jgi:hypothetical protein
VKTPFVAALLAVPAAAGAFEVNERLEVTTALRGLLQHGDYSGATDPQDERLGTLTKGAGILDLAVTLRPTRSDEFFAWARFAAGNALNNAGVVALEPYGDPLEDELTDINASGRNYLLEAWYRHRFTLGDERSLGLTAGIIDSDEFIGGNELTDDEDTQFMNEGFGYSGTDVFPAYDPGGGLELTLGRWSVSAVAMGAKNQEGNPYNYFGAQVTYRPETTLGEGSYRLFTFTTDDAFANAQGTRDDERLTGYGLSFEQEIGEDLGAFVRAFWANDRAVTDFDQQFALGLNIGGRLWGRDGDNAGIGYAQLRGPAGAETSRADVAEAYVRFQLTEYLDLSLDLQYQENHLRQTDEASNNDLSSPSAWISGIRVNLVF